MSHTNAGAIQCPKCGELNARRAETCVICLAPLPPAPEEESEPELVAEPAAPPEPHDLELATKKRLAVLSVCLLAVISVWAWQSVPPT